MIQHDNINKLYVFKQNYLQTRSYKKHSGFKVYFKTTLAWYYLRKLNSGKLVNLWKLSLILNENLSTGKYQIANQDYVFREAFLEINVNLQSFS